MIKISKNRAFNDKIIFLTFNMNRIRNINQNLILIIKMSKNQEFSNNFFLIFKKY